MNEQQYEDQNLNNLLQEMDELIKRMGPEPTEPEILRQTGKFGDASTPKRFSQTPQKKKVKLKSPSSSSSSSSDEYQIRRKKSAKTKSILSRRSNVSKSKSNISRQRSQITHQKQQKISSSEDVFCVICEEFIPIQFVNQHQNECTEQQGLNTKLFKLQKLLTLRYEQKEDEEIRAILQILHGCTQQIIEAQDSYSLNKCIDDLCVIKTQLNAESQYYNILTVASKIHDISQQKSLLLNNVQEERQTQQTMISYCTNATTNVQRRKLFEQTQTNIFPKQLVKFPQRQNIVETRKPGIEYGDSYNSSNKKKFIILSSQKKEAPSQSRISVTPPQRESVISQISGFLSKNSGNQERNKKKFFDLAVKLKGQYKQDHPAQNILISEMYEQMRKQQINEENWGNWIDNIYKKA